MNELEGPHGKATEESSPRLAWMDLDEFQRDGFLQEVNRRFFHPLGLALSVERDDDGNLSRIAGVIDGRDDPEGFIFADLDDNDVERGHRISQELFLSERAAARRRLFKSDSIVQPLVVS